MTTRLYIPISTLITLATHNAKLCEQALQPRCACICKGKYHGKKHGAEFIKRSILYSLRRIARRQPKGF